MDNDRSIILETIKLRKEFGALVAVNDVSTQVRANTIHSIIGPNGAGKTTFFNLLSGNITPTSGRVIYKGSDKTYLPVHRTAHIGIGRSFQITNLFPALTVLENTRLASQALGRDNFKWFRHFTTFKHYEEKAWEALKAVGLEGKALLPVLGLSHGDQRKLELAMIISTDPELMLLDEPTAGMAAEQVPELIELIRKIQTTGGKTVILVEHNMSVVMNISDFISVMHMGSLLAEGTPAEISANQEVQQAYLGQLYGSFENKTAEG